jgi:hypothetical protein
MASTYLTRTPSLAGNRKTWTYSAWFKIGNVSTGAKRLFTSYDGSTATNQSTISLADTIQIYNAPSGSSSINLTTNRLFRDCNAWYHIVVAVDTTQATGSNRVKLYINGVQETSFSIETYGSQNEDFFINSTNLHTIGRRQDNSQYFDGEMSHVNFIDGTQYQASDFGEYDANGVWKINTSPSVTYGTNGFFILKNGNSVTDQSGNSNNFTVAGGTLTNTEDNPSNVFATFNPLQTGSASVSNAPLTNGNNTFTSSEGAGVYPYYFSTLGMSSGKYYAEFKFVNSDSGTAGIGNGVADQYSGSNAYDYSYYYDGRLYNNGSGESTGYGAISNNDILGCALDLDNNKIYFHINGTYQASGDPVAGTGGKSITAPASNGTGFYQFEVGDSGSTSPTTIQTNFGNGYFGTTAVSSAGTNASGIGIFEYDVPTGYTALSTKGLNL